VAGSFLHLHLAIGAFSAAFGRRPEERPAELAAFLAGCLAPDVGFFPGGPRVFSRRVHHEATGDLLRSLLTESSSTVDEAFTAGWALHVETDAAIHPLINRQASHPPRAPFSSARQDLWHKRIEWGLDCEILGATAYEPPLWKQELYSPADLLVRAARPLYGGDADPLRLSRGLASLAGWIPRLARILFWSGAVARGATVNSKPHVHCVPRVARALAHRLDGVRYAEDAVALLTPEVPEEGFTLQVLAAADVAVAAFHRGWAESFANVVNRDLDSGQVTTA
jgi:hypothetical protein